MVHEGKGEGKTSYSGAKDPNQKERSKVIVKCSGAAPGLPLRTNRPARRLIKSNDFVRLLFWSPKLMLKLMFLWPATNSSRLRGTAWYIANMTVCCFVLFGMCLYIKEHWDNFNESSYVMCTLIYPLTAIPKLTFLWYNSKEIKLLIDHVMKTFWPYDLIDGNSKRSITHIYKYNNITVFFLYVIGADHLLLSFILSLMSQYCILEECFLMFNTKDVISVNKRMRKIFKDGLEEKFDEKKEFFFRCVQHHQMLLSYFKRLNRLLNGLEMGELAITVLGLGFGILRITIMENGSTVQMAANCMYIFGVLTQLCLDCFLGTLLYYQGSLLPDAIFQNNWMELEDKELKNDVKFVLHHSQRIPQLTAYNLYDLHLVSFLKVLKLSFSIYTVLSSFARN